MAPGDDDGDDVEIKTETVLKQRDDDEGKFAHGSNPPPTRPSRPDDSDTRERD